MTSPWGNPPHLPHPPRTWPPTAITVQLRPCCGLMLGDVCTCPCLVAEARIVAAFSDPIILPPHSDVPCLTDPALDVCRPGPDMVQAMESPLRWKVTADGVEVTL